MNLQAVHQGACLLVLDLGIERVASVPLTGTLPYPKVKGRLGLDGHPPILSIKQQDPTF